MAVVQAPQGFDLHNDFFFHNEVRNVLANQLATIQAVIDFEELLRLACQFSFGKMNCQILI